MQRRDKLKPATISRRKVREIKPQSKYIGMSESQLRAFVTAEKFDEIPTGRVKSMSRRRVYGYNSIEGRGRPNWQYVHRWLKKQVGRPKTKVQEEFNKLWKDGGMDKNRFGENPLGYLESYHIDREYVENVRRGKFYWNENNILCAYPEKNFCKVEYPSYSTLEKRKANKLVWDENFDKLSGNGPIGIGRYYVAEDRGKDLHPVLAIRTELWNQAIQANVEASEWKTALYKESRTLWFRCPKLNDDFLHFLYQNYKPVSILGIGCSTYVVKNSDQILGKEYLKYMFVVPK